MKMIIITSAIAIGSFMFLTQVHASIDLTTYGSQPSNSGDHTINSWLSTLVSNYNGIPSNTDLPIPDSSYSYKVGNGNSGAPSGYPNYGAGATSIIIPTGGYDYVVLHWGQGQTAYPFQAYYIGTDQDLLAGSVTLNNNQNGLSDYYLFGPTPPTSSVPEPSTIVAGVLLLLPLSVGVLRVVRKKQMA